MTKGFYNQSASTPSGSLYRKDEPREAAKRSIDRVGQALDKVFADARAQQDVALGHR